jgi:hypothetical protein
MKYDPSFIVDKSEEVMSVLLAKRFTDCTQLTKDSLWSFFIRRQQFDTM